MPFAIYPIAVALLVGLHLWAASGVSPYAAVRGLAECIQQDLAPQNIGVAVLCPGAVNTNIHEAVLTRPKHLSNTGYYGADPTVMKSLKEVIAPVISPATS